MGGARACRRESRSARRGAARVDAAQLAGLDERVKERSDFGAAVGLRAAVILSADNVPRNARSVALLSIASSDKHTSRPRQRSNMSAMARPTLLCGNTRCASAHAQALH